MVKVISEFKAKSQETFKPDQLLNSLNTQLVKGAKTGLFVTCSYLVIDILKKSAELSDAGHLPLIHYKEKEKAIKEVRPKKGMPIGLMLEADFEIEKLQLSKADALVFYTDGAIEARNLKGEEFGLTRLKDAVSRLHSKDALSVLEGIKDDILNFQGKAPAHDDLTLVVVKVL
jgi:sigma-B regulation protein RsbU (phosphoserine phosphatase)